MAVKKDREYRSINLQMRTSSADGEKLFVEGYAATFNDTTVLYEYDGIQYKENIDSKAFSGVDLSDVIFNYNHGGKVISRTRNKTLELRVDSRGLYIRARLDGTEEGRKLYEEIRGGYIDRMSFAFSVDKDSYDKSTRTRTILKFKRIYDVSAVDIPAYQSTSIHVKRSEDEALRRKRLALLTRL